MDTSLIVTPVDTKLSEFGIRCQNICYYRLFALSLWISKEGSDKKTSWSIITQDDLLAKAENYAYHFMPWLC